LVLDNCEDWCVLCQSIANTSARIYAGDVRNVASECVNDARIDARIANDIFTNMGSLDDAIKSRLDKYNKQILPKSTD